MSFFLMAVLFLLAIVVFFLLLGRFTPGNGADLIDWDPIGKAEEMRERKLDDFDEILELTNRKRRERGLPEQAKRDVTERHPQI